MSKQSIAAFVENSLNGKIATQKAKVYRYVRYYGHDLQTMRTRIGMAHQSLTACLSILMDEGLVRQTETGKFLSVAPERYEYYQDQRLKERYEKWKKAGDKQGFFALLTKERFA